MEQYISKSAIATEIRKRLLPTLRAKHYDEWEEGQNSKCIAILEIIDTLEVKEVDIDKEIEEEYLKRRCYGGKNNMLVILNEPQFNKIAKHFFELGLNAQKGE